MSSPSVFDLRLPLGYLFAVLGALLCLQGGLMPAADVRSLGINVNLIWGGVMIAFGLVCLLLARRAAARRRRRENTTPERK